MSTKISQLTSATDVTANDLIQIVDVEDGVMAPSGTNKKATASLLAKELAKQPLEPGVVISGSSSSDAVRITQTGTGNALVVEDSANPDATPFVVTSNGNVGIGLTPEYNFEIYGSGSTVAQLQSDTSLGITARVSNTSTASPSFSFTKSRGSVASKTIVSDNDGLGTIAFAGYDGVKGVQAAMLTAQVDGVPGTDDMPGRLVFSTTSNGSNFLSERMRIASTGNVGIGTGATTPAAKLTVLDGSVNDAVRITQTGSGNALVVEDAASPDSTPVAITATGQLLVGNKTNINTPVGNAPLQVMTGAAVIRYSDVFQPRVDICRSKSNTTGTNEIVVNNDTVGEIAFCGADGTNYVPAGMIGVLVDGTPGTGDMPGRLVFSTTADGASTPTERMRINSAGNVGIGAAPAAGRRLDIRGSATGSTDASHVFCGGAIASDVTAEFKSFSSLPSTAAAAFTLGTLDHYRAGQGTLGAGSLVTSQSGFKAGATLIGANLNHGFFSDIGNASATVSNVALTSNVVTLTTSGNHGFTVNQRILVASSVTAVNGLYTIVSVPSLTTLTYAKTNADIPSAAATGTITSAGRWNFYADGSSPNYFNGDVRIGTTNSGAKVNVVAASTDDAVRITQTSTGNALVVEDSTNPDTTRFVITADGDVGIGLTTPLAKLDVVESDTASTTDAVRITNTGTGNSLVVEDAANPDTTPFIINSGGSVAIGTATVNGSCLLQMTSTTKGFKPPSLTTTERNAIATPLAGVMVYNSTTNKLNFYNGTAWEAVTSAV